jgi:hypothetical protein
MPFDMGQFFGGNYIRAEDLEEGVIYEDTIVRWDIQPMRGKSLPVIWFANGKGIVLNQARGNAMMDGYGRDGDAWIGQVVRYRRVPTMLDGHPSATIEIVPPPPPADGNAKRP